MEQTQRHSINLQKPALMLAALIVVALESVDPALAQATGGGFQAIDSGFATILSWMTGTTATTVCTISVAFFGYMSLTGRIPWERALGIIFGICFIFGAAQVVEVLRSGAGGI